MSYLLWTAAAVATVVLPCTIAFLCLPQSDGRGV